MYAYGTSIAPDVLVNISQDTDVLAYVLRLVYLLITSMQIPLVFFVGKEAVISIYEEIMYRAITNKVERLYLEGAETDATPAAKQSKIMAYGSKL